MKTIFDTYKIDAIILNWRIFKMIIIEQRMEISELFKATKTNYVLSLFKLLLLSSN